MAILLGIGPVAAPARLHAAKLTVELGNSRGVALVGVFNRWDQDGNPRKKVNPRAKIDEPEVDATAEKTGENTWVFKNLPPGRYDLLIMGAERVRIEGWTYAPVLEFDPFFPADASTKADVRKSITGDIKKSRHYENKVVPLAMGGSEDQKTQKVVRVLVMLIRDLPTSYTPGAGTMRFEIWQYTWKYGGWVKERRTRVIHRVLLQVSELRRWHWLWDPKLGGIEVKSEPVTIRYEMPDHDGLKSLKGLHPY